MRTKEEIEKSTLMIKVDKLTLEVLLDIRDLLVEIRDSDTALMVHYTGEPNS